MHHDPSECEDDCDELDFWLENRGEPEGVLDVFYHHGELHRLDGPAIVTTDVSAWYFAGRLLSGPDSLQCVNMLGSILYRWRIDEVIGRAEQLAVREQPDRDSFFESVAAGRPLEWAFKALEARP